MITGINESKTLAKLDHANVNVDLMEEIVTKSIAAFLLITIVLLIPVSIYCYLVKHRAKQKHLLPFHNTNYKLEQVLY